MYISKNLMTIGLLALILVASLAVLSPLTIIIIVTTLALVLLGSYAAAHVSIDYKYAGSFVMQLLGLILIVVSLVALFSVLSNLIVF